MSSLQSAGINSSISLFPNFEYLYNLEFDDIVCIAISLSDFTYKQNVGLNTGLIWTCLLVLSVSVFYLITIWIYTSL